MAEDYIPSELVMRYRRATGMPVMAAKRALEACDPNDRIPLLVASENRTPSDGVARDPQEDDAQETLRNFHALLYPSAPMSFM